MIHFYAETYNR